MHYLQKELFEQVQNDQSTFEFLMRSCADGMWFWDLEKPENEWMSSDFWELFGYDPENMPHSSAAWQNIIHPDDLEEAKQNVALHLEDPNHPYDQVVRYKHGQTGEWVWVRCRGMAVRDANGKPIRLLGAHNDLTDQMRAASELEQRNAELEVAQSKSEQALRAKTAFLELVSHEIRTPMNGVVGMTQALMRTDLDSKQKRMVELISAASAALLELLNDVLELSRLEADNSAIECQHFAPVHLVLEVVNLFETAAREAGVRLQTELLMPLSQQVYGSERALRQVLTNLLSNAIKFTPEGRILVAIGIAEDADGDEMLELRVSDTGPGVPDDKKGSIFGRFTQIHETSKDTSGGVGLGLSIAYRLCAAHAGRIWVEDADGGGACFVAHFSTVETKIAEASRTSAAADPPAAEPRTKGGLVTGEPAKRHPEPNVAVHRNAGGDPDWRPKLLIAEDNDMNRIVIEAMLEPCGANLTFAENGRIALDLAMTKDFDAGIIDIRMPEMTGTEFAMELRAHEASAGRTPMPLIACSANNMPHQVEEYLGSGFDRFLPKPLDMETVRETVDWIHAMVRSVAAAPGAPDLGLEAG